jgi:PAS domain S-box-containing protein
MPPAAPELAAFPDKTNRRLDRALVAAFLENVPDAVYFKDRESRFIALSTSLARSFGCVSADEVIGRTDFDFFGEAHARPALEDELEIMRTGRPILGKLEKETWPDGRITWAVTNKLPLRDESGEIIGTFGLSKDVTESKRMEVALEQAQRNLVDASHQAGMAEVATGVLHNVGNVLNSVNVSASLLASGLRHAKVDSLARLSALLRAHAGDLGAFLTTDPRGRRVPEFVESLAQDWAGEQARLLKEIESLQQNIDHIKDIVSMQQSYATMVSLVEPLPPAALMEDAVRMNSAALSRHEVRVLRDFQPVPLVSAEKAKVLQILVNLVRNAKYACDDGPNPADKAITLRLALAPGGRAVRLVVADNGVGIPAANLTRIFNHGFTTRATGHGFGLHSSANAAKEMKGTLSVHSDGPGTGATFTLELPVATPNPGPDSDQGLDEAGPV